MEMKEFKKKLVVEYEKETCERLMVIGQDGTKYVPADFTNYVVRRFFDFFYGTRKAVGMIEFADLTEKVMEAVDGRG